MNFNSAYLHLILTILFATCGITGWSDEKAKKVEPEFECRFAHGEIKIDGKADDESWKSAQLIDNFYLPWLQENARPARTSTKARLLWDREYLYFFAEMEDTDIYADETKQDGKLGSMMCSNCFSNRPTTSLGITSFK